MAFQDERDYFYPYAFLTDQRLMLEDEPRMAGYHKAIFQNAAEHFAGKAVLDCGTDTGILACWAAQAGARVVYAVEATGMARHARTLVEANGLGDTVKVLQGKIEDISLPEKVDTIVSEWMGLLLLRDGMLNSVLAARDKWLAPGGSLFPSHCQLFLAPTHFSSACAPPAGKAAPHDQVMQEWSELVEEVKGKWAVDYSCLTSALVAEKDTYHLQTAIEDILGGGGADDAGDSADEFQCEFEEVDDEDDEDLIAIMGDGRGEQGPGLLPSRWTAMTDDALLGEAQLIKEIDCNTVSASDLESFDCDFQLRVMDAEGQTATTSVEATAGFSHPDGNAQAEAENTAADGIDSSSGSRCGRLNSLTCWFDVQFNGSSSAGGGLHPSIKEAVVLSTGPASAPTHWGQQTFMLPAAAAAATSAAAPGDVESCTLEGKMRISRLPTTHRMYSARISFSHSLEFQDATAPALITRDHVIEYSIE